MALFPKMLQTSLLQKNEIARAIPAFSFSSLSKINLGNPKSGGERKEQIKSLQINFPPFYPGRTDGRKAQLRIFAARLSRLGAKFSPFLPLPPYFFSCSFRLRRQKFVPFSFRLLLFSVSSVIIRERRHSPMRHHDNDFPQIFSPSLKCSFVLDPWQQIIFMLFLNLTLV